jgi:hypothetical protein
VREITEAWITTYDEAHIGLWAEYYQENIEIRQKTTLLKSPLEG